jgi:hypothetical protein
MVLCQSAGTRAPRHAARAHHDHPMGPNIEAAYHPPVRAPWDRPCRPATPTLSLCATCSRRPRRQPNCIAPYARRPAPGWLLAIAACTALAPCRNPLCNDSRDPLHKARAPIKELTSPPRTLPHAEPLLSRPVVLPVKSTSGCLSSQTRAAPHSTRVPSSFPFRVLLRPSR